MAISFIEENGEHIDWIEEDEFDLSDVKFITNKDVEDNHAMPLLGFVIHTLDEHLNTPWAFKICDILLRGRGDPPKFYNLLQGGRGQKQTKIA